MPWEQPKKWQKDKKKKKKEKEKENTSKTRLGLVATAGPLCTQSLFCHATAGELP